MGIRGFGAACASSFASLTLVVIAEHSAEQELAERLDGHGVLAAGEDDPRERNAALVLHGIADDREGLFARLAVGDGVVGAREIPPVDLLDGNERVDVERVGAFNLDRLDLFGLDLDVLALAISYPRLFSSRSTTSPVSSSTICWGTRTSRRIAPAWVGRRLTKRSRSPPFSPLYSP